MKKFSLFVLLAIFTSVIFYVVGCASKTVNYTKTTDTAGIVTENTVTTTSGSWWSSKTIAGAGSVQALKVETTGSTSSGTMLHQLCSGRRAIV